jgi:5-formyltetrahydrofolate cyclo-ligase
VDIEGNRLGKGKGYGDREWSWLQTRDLLTNGCKIVTIVHDKQIVKDFSYLVEETDKKVDYILTPTKIIDVSRKDSVFKTSVFKDIYFRDK